MLLLSGKQICIFPAIMAKNLNPKPPDISQTDLHFSVYLEFLL